MQQLSTDKFPSLAYRKAGQGPVLMLVHGFPENGGLWDKVIPLLEKDFTVIAPDLPGTGESSLVENMTIEDMAHSLDAILRHEGIEQAVVAGHSMGGYTALAFAELYPQKLVGLSLVHSAAGADDEEKKETRRKSIELIKKEGGKEAFVKQMIPNLFAASFKEQQPEVLQEQIERANSLPAESMIAFYKAMINRPERISILKKISCPVQWIIGKEDSVVPPAKAAEQSKESERTFVTVYENSAHMSMLEMPVRLAGDLKEFAQYCYHHHLK